MREFDSPAVLAANFAVNFDVVKVVIFALVVLITQVLRKVAEAREQAARGKPVPKPQTPPPVKRENQFRNEIEAFLEEVGRRRSPTDQAGGDMPRPVVPVPIELPKTRPTPRPESARPDFARAEPSRPELTKPSMASRPARSAQPPNRAKPEAPPPLPASGPGPRPGAEMASRKAPVTNNLGGQVRAHTAQYLDSSRMTEQVQSDMGNAVERAVRSHLGPTVTRGTSEKNPVAVASASENSLAALLRDPAGMRTAVVLHEILGRPKGLRRKT